MSFIGAMTHSYVPWLLHICHDSFICAMTPSYLPWLIYMSHDPMSFTHVLYLHMSASLICVTWLIYTCVTWVVHVCHDSFMCVMTHSYASHKSFRGATWLIHTCDDSFIRARTHSYVIGLIHMRHTDHSEVISVPWLIHKCDMTHS